MDETQARQLAEDGLREVLGQNGGPISWEAPVAQTLREIGLTSLMLYELVSVLEDLGGLRFRDEDIDSTNFATLASVRDLLTHYPVGHTSRAKPPDDDALPC